MQPLRRLAVAEPRVELVDQLFGGIADTLHLLLVIVAVRPGARKNGYALRGQIRLQGLPRHERDILAFGVGTDRVGRIMKCQAGAFAGLGRRRQRHRADLEQPGLQVFVRLRRRGIAGAALANDAQAKWNRDRPRRGTD